MKTALAIRHVAFEDLAAFAEPLRDSGYAVRYHDIGIDAWPPPPADLLIVLGGPIGAYEDDAYPFLRAEKDLLAARLAARLPTLGICLGAQLMAASLGARVYPGPAKEIGWAPIALTDAGKGGPLAPLADVTLLHWHGDTFDLPEGASLLASTALCRHQAFAIGAHALAFQFHPEAEEHGFERWLIGHCGELAVCGLSVTALRRDAARFGDAARAAGRACLVSWLAGLPPSGSVAGDASRT
jgi:GMP synthase (glutamine-hydrolysing)